MKTAAATEQGGGTPPEERAAYRQPSAHTPSGSLRGRLLTWGCSPHTLGRGRPPCTLFPCALLALMALLAGLGALALSGITPFGSHTLCWQDNGQQVASDFGYVRGVWEGRHTLDWSYACGGSPRSSFHPTFNNLCSPLTWAVAAIPGISAVTGLSLLLLLQLTFLPLGAFCYLRKTFPRLPAALGMALSLAYAFGGFTVSKYTFLPFLNIAMVFPWYVVALDSLLRRGRWLPYALLLAFMLAVGTYFAWMWLLFTAVYAAARTGWRWSSGVRQHTLTLFLASAAALVLSAWSWLPSLFVTAGSARAGEAHWWWNATRAEMESFFIEYLICLFVPMGLLLSLKFRLRWSRYALTLLVLLVGLAFTSATTLWHLSRPWDFAGRFAYMVDFMLICLLAQGVYPFCRGRKPLRWRWVPAVLLLLPLGYALWMMEGCFLWVFCLVLLLCFLYAACWKWRWYAVSVGLTLVFPLFCFCSELDMDNWFRQNTYQASAARIKLAEWAAQQVPQPEGRAKSRGLAAVENLAFLTPFDSLSHFTACITAEQEETLPRWGYQRRTAVISSEGGTAASDTLLGLRYTLSQAEDGAPYRWEENPYFFGVGLMVPAGFLSGLAEEADLITRQQSMLTQLLGAEHAGTRSRAYAWESLELPPESLHYVLQREGVTGHMEIDLYYEGWPYARWETVEALPHLMEVPSRVRVGHDAMGIIDFSLYHLPHASLAALRVYGQELPVRCEYAGRRMSVSCHSTEARPLLFLPFLWQRGYEAEVDGEPVAVQNLEGFVGIAMPSAGEHQVELLYRAPGKLAGLLISVAALPLLLLARLHLKPASEVPLNTLCRRLLLVVSLLLLLWPLLVLPVGLLWR